jgi:hypothetical protein
MNALKSIGTKIVTAMVATGLIAGAAFGADGYMVTVTLPDAVNVSGATLPGGQYTITESTMADGNSLFIFRSEKGGATSAVALKSAEPAVYQKTEIVFSNEGGTLHLDKMFIKGDGAGYQFAEK